MPTFRTKNVRVCASIVAFIAISAFIYSNWFTSRGALRQYGVSYDDDSTVFASPTLKEFTCFRTINGKKYGGPSVTGTMLKVEPPILTEHGILQFRVRAWPDKSYFADIELLREPIGNQAFRVANSDSSMLNIHYPEQGIIGAP